MACLSSSAAVLAAGLAAAWVSLGAADAPKQVIGHRGASGYAPEHTLASYKLAIQQKADFVEPDLGVTKDGILVCLHDDTLERTTNVAEVFPNRPSQGVQSRQPGKHWLVNDFTLAELEQLDAGKWYKPEFAGEKMVSFQEMIDLVRTTGNGAGIYPELKSPPLYKSRGLDMEQIFVAQVTKNGLEKPDSLKKFPVIIQSFDEESVRRVAVDLPTIPRVFLTSSGNDVTDARLAELATFATGIGPEKRVVAEHPDMVARAHKAGLTVTSWTFSATEKTAYASVKDEMSHFLYDLGIDALFTNNPDQFPRR
jgi:glycerophosphoryl diester phosphodiesterase